MVQVKETYPIQILSPAHQRSTVCSSRACRNNQKRRQHAYY